MTDLRDRLDRLAERFPERGGIDGLQHRRGRRPERQRFMTAALALLIAAVGITSAYIALEPTGEVARPFQSTIPDVADIVCDGVTTDVSTPEVRPQRNGVHWRFENTASVPIRIDVSHGEAGDGRPVDPGEVDEITTGSGPGPAQVKCSPVRMDPSDFPARTIEVVDPEGVWAPDEIDCRGGIVTGAAIHYTADAPGGDDPEAVAREMLADDLAPGDELVRGGYPESRDTVIVVLREGRAVAAVGFSHAQDGGWLATSMHWCADFKAAGGPTAIP